MNVATVVEKTIGRDTWRRDGGVGKTASWDAFKDTHHHQQSDWGREVQGGEGGERAQEEGGERREGEAEGGKREVKAGRKGQGEGKEGKDRAGTGRSRLVLSDPGEAIVVSEIVYQVKVDDGGRRQRQRDCGLGPKPTGRAKA